MNGEPSYEFCVLANKFEAIIDALKTDNDAPELSASERLLVVELLENVARGNDGNEERHFMCTLAEAILAAYKGKHPKGRAESIYTATGLREKGRPHKKNTILEAERIEREAMMEVGFSDLVDKKGDTPRS